MVRKLAFDVRLPRETEIFVDGTVMDPLSGETVLCEKGDAPIEEVLVHEFIHALIRFLTDHRTTLKLDNVTEWRNAQDSECHLAFTGKKFGSGTIFYDPELEAKE